MSVRSSPALASLELSGRIERAFRTLLYIALGLPLGALGLLALVAVALAGLLALAGLGGPLPLAIRGARRVADLDRRAANRLLDAHIAPLPRRARVAGSPWRRAPRSATASSGASRRSWRCGCPPAPCCSSPRSCRSR